MISYNWKRGVSAAAMSIAACASFPVIAQEALPDVDIVADRSGLDQSRDKVRYQLPQTAASVTGQKLDETVQVVDTEDAVKYLPSLFVRKRNAGDTQPVLATRTWGLGSSARSLVYADDILLSALVANNNTIGAPRWGLVAPEEIERVDFLYGPFAAAYPGNSMGGVLQITTRMPDKLEVSAKQTESFQTFNQYGTKKVYPTSQTSASIGNRVEAFSWFLSANFQDSFSQPLIYITNGTAPAGTTGTYPATNRTGGAANVVGAGGLLHTDMLNAKMKLAVDMTSWMRATYTLGYWQNNASSKVETYLTSTATGAPTFGGVNGFAGGNYKLFQSHLANAVSLKTDTHGVFDFDLSASRYDVLADIQRNPWAVTTGTNFSSFGKIARLEGTNWMNADAKGIWRPFGVAGAHEISFGIHGDRYDLSNPVYRTATWDSGSDSGGGTLYSSSRGTTATAAVWLQDVWRFAPDFKLTTGGRLESWKASKGFTLATTTNATTGNITNTLGTVQPEISATRFSPKASLSWDFAREWTATGSLGVANRFPTVTELYQTVTSGSNVVSPNPNLKPEQATSVELAVERRFDKGAVRISLFEETTRNALISQSSFVAPDTTTLYSYVSNIDKVRTKGVEIAAQRNDVLIDGLELSGSLTYADARILSDPTWSAATTVVGKHAPYVPDWRATMAATYRPNDRWSFTVAGRYSGRQYATLDNTDIVPGVYQAFDRFFVVDSRVHFKASDQVSIDVGIDNLNNEKYFLFHPFPGRTFYASGKIKF